MIAPKITIAVGPRESRQQRIVVATDEAGKELHRDSINTNSAPSRARFLKTLASKVSLPPDELNDIDRQITTGADNADEAVESKARQRGDFDGENKSQSEMLVDQAHEAGIELYKNKEGAAFAKIPVQSHHENMPVRSREFRLWLQQRFYEEYDRPACATAIRDAIEVLEAQALYEGEVHAVHVRVAEFDGAIFVDLANGNRDVVRIDKTEWSVISNSPVRFLRPKGMLPLSTPVSGGDIRQLRRFINVADAYWPLVLAWLVASLLPSGPYPLLCLHGEQGAAKSTTAKLLRRLIDPNTAATRCEPKDARDLMIAAMNGWIISLDNLSYLQPWFSDALCRLSTGGGFSTRTLYTNDEETIFDAQRPIILNGIEEVATRSDLIDRSLLVRLQEIPEDRRKTEQELFRDFGNEEPVIFGALLTAVSAGLRELPTIKLDSKPRMADFAMWAAATETALGFDRGTFIASYQRNQADANDMALESSPVATLLLELLEAAGKWEGTAAAIKARLEIDLGGRPPRGWPISAKGMAGCLRRLAPNLRQAGWEVSQDRDNTRKRNRMWRITKKVVGVSVQTVQSVHEPLGPAGEADARRTVDNDCPVSESLDRTIADGADDQFQTKPVDHNPTRTNPHDF